MLQSGGQNQKWPTSGPGGYITPAVWGPAKKVTRCDEFFVTRIYREKKNYTYYNIHQSQGQATLHASYSKMTP